MMVGIGMVTGFKNWLEIWHNVLVLEARRQPATMVVSGTVIRDILQSMNERLVQHRVARNVTIGSLVQGKPNSFPFVTLELPACDDGNDFY